jgi:hypothetical protein
MGYTENGHDFERENADYLVDGLGFSPNSSENQTLYVPKPS